MLSKGQSMILRVCITLICLVQAVPVGAATLTQITDDPARDWDPSWSRDGTMLVFTSGRLGRDQLWLVPAVGGASAQLTDDPTRCIHPAWSPDGKFIAFVSQRSGNQDIWTIRPDGSGLRQITENPNRDESLGWLRKRIVFDSNRTGDWEIWSVPRRGGDAAHLTESPGHDVNPNGSRDGSRIAFSSDREGALDLWVIPTEGGEATRLTSLLGLEGMPDWSPGDGTIAFSSDGNGGNWDIWMVQTSGGRPWRVTTDSADDMYPAWSPDGSRLAFSSYRAGNEDIWILDLTGVAGCLELGGDPLTESPLRLKQPGRPMRRLEAGREGCFMFPALRESKKFKLKLDGREVTVEGAGLTACFDLNSGPLVRTKAILKQPGRGARSQRTGDDGCVSFDGLAGGTTFKLTLKGPRIVSEESEQ